MAGNVIFRGPTHEQPDTVNLSVNGALKPGSFVVESANRLAQATGGAGRVMALSNRRFYEGDITTPYEDGETGVAYRLRPEDEYNLLAATGNYTKGAPLSINGDGVLAAASANDVIVAFADESLNLAQEGFIDVVIADKTVSA